MGYVGILNLITHKYNFLQQPLLELGEHTDNNNITVMKGVSYGWAAEMFCIKTDLQTQYFSAHPCSLFQQTGLISANKMKWPL